MYNNNIHHNYEYKISFQKKEKLNREGCIKIEFKNMKIFNEIFHIQRKKRNDEYILNSYYL